MNRGKSKIAHTSQEVAELAEEIASIARRLAEFSDAMRESGQPTFSFRVKNARNDYLAGLSDWIDTLDLEWKRQSRLWQKSARLSQRLAAGEKRLGRPPKK